MREKHLSVEAAPSAMASQMALSPGAQSGRRNPRTASRLWGMPVTSPLEAGAMLTRRRLWAPRCIGQELLTELDIPLCDQLLP